MTQSRVTITLLADRPELAPKWAALHWREWGDEPGREELSWWVNDAAQAIQRTRVPVAFIALGQQDEVLGGVGVHQFDLPERRDRSPWVVGTIVRADQRGAGIGQALMARLETWAVSVGISQVWVGTGTAGKAVAFYRRCGYHSIENLTSRQGEDITILTKQFALEHQGVDI